MADATASRSSTESSTTVLTPAVSVKAIAGWALRSTHEPNVGLPVKSYTFWLHPAVVVVEFGGLPSHIAGMELESRFEDWDGTPFNSESEKHVSVWRKK